MIGAAAIASDRGDFERAIAFAGVVALATLFDHGEAAEGVRGHVIPLAKDTIRLFGRTVTCFPMPRGCDIISQNLPRMG